jgi:hypothetical protein
MMPIITAIELEVPVIGRSYSPAFFGAFCAMCNSFVRHYKCSSDTLGTLAFYACGITTWATGGSELLLLKGNSHAKLFFFLV